MKCHIQIVNNQVMLQEFFQAVVINKHNCIRMSCVHNFQKKSKRLNAISKRKEPSYFARNFPSSCDQQA
jgi:hypothetical protein